MCVNIIDRCVCSADRWIQIEILKNEGICDCIGGSWKLWDWVILYIRQLKPISYHHDSMLTSKQSTHITTITAAKQQLLDIPHLFNVSPACHCVYPPVLMNVNISSLIELSTTCEHLSISTSQHEKMRYLLIPASRMTATEIQRVKGKIEHLFCLSVQPATLLYITAPQYYTYSMVEVIDMIYIGVYSTPFQSDVGSYQPLHLWRYKELSEQHCDSHWGIKRFTIRSCNPTDDKGKRSSVKWQAINSETKHQHDNSC